MIHRWKHNGEIDRAAKREADWYDNEFMRRAYLQSLASKRRLTVARFNAVMRCGGWPKRTISGNSVGASITVAASVRGGVISTIRREYLGHVIVFNEASLYRYLKSFVSYYHESRTNLSLAKDSPESRLVQPPELGQIVAVPQVGGLHHRYERGAA